MLHFSRVCVSSDVKGSWKHFFSCIHIIFKNEYVLIQLPTYRNFITFNLRKLDWLVLTLLLWYRIAHTHLSLGWVYNWYVVADL